LYLDALDRRIRQHFPGLTYIQQLCIAIEEEWTNIPQATINNFPPDTKIIGNNIVEIFRPLLINDIMIYKNRDVDRFF